MSPYAIDIAREIVNARWGGPFVNHISVPSVTVMRDRLLAALSSGEVTDCDLKILHDAHDGTHPHIIAHSKNGFDVIVPAALD